MQDQSYDIFDIWDKRPEPDTVVAERMRVLPIANTQSHDIIIQEYLWHTGQRWNNNTPDRVMYTSDADHLPEFAGRVCYQSFETPRPGGNAGYLEHIRTMGHGSILEHVYSTVVLTGVSRNLTHELVRHRAGFGFSQLSQRYVDARKAKFVPPYEIWRDDISMKIWGQSCQRAREDYTVLYERLRAQYAARAPLPEPNPGTVERVEPVPTALRKAAWQAARSVLPGSIETHIVVTANLRAWRHFMAQRGSEGADSEIRMLACVIAGGLKVLAPNVMADVHLRPSEDGAGCVHLDYPKI